MCKNRVQILVDVFGAIPKDLEKYLNTIGIDRISVLINYRGCITCNSVHRFVCVCVCV